MEGQIQIKQLPSAEFWYEFQFTSVGIRINLYDRISDEGGENILRFLVQVPFKEDKAEIDRINLENSVKQAVNLVYKKMGATTLPIMRIQAEPLGDCNHLMPFFDYLR